MKAEFDDIDIRERFHELRDEVTESASPFMVPAVPKRTSRMRRYWTFAAVGATAALAILLLTRVIPNGPETAPGIDLSIVAWTAPSDYLLDTPGRDLLRTVPGIDIENYTVTSSDFRSGVADTSS